MGFWSYWFIIFEGKIYFSFQTHMWDDDAVYWLSQKLTGITKEKTFEAVQRSTIRWQPYDDLINPYPDHQEESITSVWTLDLDNDMLMLGEPRRNWRLPLATIRQRGIALEDLQRYEPAPLPKVDVQGTFPPPYWDPPEHTLELVTPFVTRILTDFAYQWRHILQNRYNQSTLVKLASAVIRIATLDFEVVEEGQRHGQSNPYMVGVPGLPEWPPLTDTSVVQRGTVRVILSQDSEHENWMSLLRNDYTNQKNDTTYSQQDSENVARHTTYLVLSLKHVMLCNIDDKSLRYMQPEPLFDGTNPPSKRAIELLLYALQPAPLETSLHYLSAELQDMVVRNVSESEVENARIACILGLGTPYLWKGGGKPLEKVKFLGMHHSRQPNEQQIWFEDCFTGIAYCRPYSNILEPLEGTVWERDDIAIQT